MTQYSFRVWFLAVAAAGMAGYVDAIGFLKLGGLFVSFMSGNSTRLSVGLVTDPTIALTAGRLLGAFVIGVVAGTLIAAASGSRRKPIILAVVGMLLGLAAAADNRLSDAFTTTAMAAAMGCANTIFQRAGEVSIGVTYMTGALVKFSQRLADTFMGGPRWGWFPYLALWMGLVSGAVVGGIAYQRLGTMSIGAAAITAILLAIYAVSLGPAKPSREP